jgi:hypothetical protein
MLKTQAVAKFLFATAVGISTGGAISYGAEHVRVDRVTVSVPTTAIPQVATTSRFGDFFKPVSDALR